MTKQLLESLQASLNLDIPAFMPELILCGTIVFLLLLRLFPKFDNHHLGWYALLLTVLALLAALGQWDHSSQDPRTDAGQPLNLFSGMLVFDNFAIFIKIFLLSFTALVILLCLFTGIPDREDFADFHCLLL